MGEARLLDISRRQFVVNAAASVAAVAGSAPIRAAGIWAASTAEGSSTGSRRLDSGRASRVLQLSNGRAEISIVRRGECSLEAKPEGLPAASIHYRHTFAPQPRQNMS